jgi:hypothetical protein
VHTSDFSYGHTRGVKGGGGRDKHKRRRPKLTFNELMAYVKMRDANIASQPSNMKPPRSPP